MPSGSYKRIIGINVGLNKGKTWKVKDTTNIIANKTSFQKGHTINVGRTNEKSPSWKGNRIKRIRHSDKEKLAGRPKPKQCETCGDFVDKTKTISFTSICFDHDHKTGKFRGWICRRCNTILGYVKDNPELLRSLANYLEKNK